MTTERIQFSDAETTSERPEGTEATTAERPAWLPENFESPEAFAESYKALQAKLTEKGQEKADPAPTEGKTEEKAEGTTEEESPEDKAAREATEAAGIDMKAVEEEFTSNGNKLSDERYADLEKRGFSREVVDDFIAYRVQKAEAVFDAVGGKEAFGKMAEWARGGGYDETKLKAYNAAVDSGDNGRIGQALSALKADYEKTRGTVPNLLTATGTAASTSVYESMAQFLADVNTPLYKSDPAERARVQKKLARSNV